MLWLTECGLHARGLATCLAMMGRSNACAPATSRVQLTLNIYSDCEFCLVLLFSIFAQVRETGLIFDMFLFSIWGNTS